MPSASTRLRRTSLITVAFLITVVGGMITAAATVHVSSATIIPGTVGGTASVTPVATPSGGKLAKLLVKDGQKVTGQQDLFILANDGLAEQRATLDDQLVALTIKDARITTELAGGATVELPDGLTKRSAEPAVSQALQLEQQQLTNEIAASDASIQALQAQLRSQTNSLTTLKQQQAAASSAPTPDPFNTSASAYTQQINTTTAQITQISAQMDQTRATAKTNLLSSAADNRASMNDVEARLEQADAQLADLHVKAPMSGTVSDSILAAAGQYLPPSVTVMNLVSQTDGLIVTAHLPVSDAPFVAQGDVVTVDLTTGDKLKTTSVRGRVATISANPSSKTKSAATYTVKVDVPKRAAASVGSRAALVNGMPVQVHVESGSQSILHYLVAPIAERMRFAFHER